MAPIEIKLAAPVSGRLAALDELKGLAISLVVLYHMGGVLVWENLLHGDVGVDIFVVLSGAGLSLGAREENTRNFLLKRLGRIMPTYWIALTFFWALNSYFLQKHYSAQDLVLHYLGLHGWFGDVYAMSINDSFWFITLILTLYVVYAGLRRLRAGPEAILLGGAIVSLVAALILFRTGQAGSFSHIALRMPGFFVGVVFGQLLKAGRLELELGVPLALAVFLLTYVPYTQGVVFLSTIVGLAVMGAYAFAWKPLAPVGISSALGSKLRFLGELSLPIFLFHQPLIREYNYYVHGRWLQEPTPTPFSLIIGAIFGLAVTVLISVELRRLFTRGPHRASSEESG